MEVFIRGVIIFPMEQQTDFLEKLGGDSSISTPTSHTASAEEIELNQLLEKKKELDLEIDRCPICQGESRGHCDHMSDLHSVQKRIEELESFLRG